MRFIDRNDIEEKLSRSYPLSGRWHNGFHLEMPFGLINDPNGLAFADGGYHIFFQWNPLGCEHRNKCWAYTRTADFVHYSRPKLSMWPTDAHDKDGCYSGCGFEEAGRVRVLYTCNAKDAQGVRTPAQRFGTLLTDGTVRKEEIAAAKEAEGYTAHFRDPYIFRQKNKHYFVLGAQNNALKGRAVIYGRRPEQAESWEFLGELKTRCTDFGYMWECPNFLQFAEGDVLLFCPQGLEAQELAYQNRYQCGYLAGTGDMEALSMEHGEFHELDRGFDFYAPQVMEHEGRHILLGWMGMPEEEDLYPAAEEGWLYSLTVPRELQLRDGRLYQEPVRELAELREAGSEQRIREAQTEVYHAALPERCEIKIEAVFGRAARVEAALFYGTEKLCFAYDRVQQIMTVDREGMKLGGRGRRSFPLAAADSLTLHILADTSAVEAFFQNGAETAAAAVFPAADEAPRLAVSSDAPLEQLNGSVWGMGKYIYG